MANFKIIQKQSFEDRLAASTSPVWHKLLDFTQPFDGLTIKTGIFTVDLTITWYNAGDLSASGGFRAVYVIAGRNLDQPPIQNDGTNYVPYPRIGSDVHPIPRLRLAGIHVSYWPNDGYVGCGGCGGCGGSFPPCMGLGNSELIYASTWPTASGLEPGHTLPFDQNFGYPGTNLEYENANRVYLLLTRGNFQGTADQTIFTVVETGLQQNS